MTLLLDTHVLIWWLTDDPALATNESTAIANPSGEVFVSAASAWEIEIKRALGKLEAPEDLPAALDASGLRPLPITIAHAIDAGRLPRHHDDPFDRMLVAQARAEGLTLVSRDARLRQYAVAVL